MDKIKQYYQEIERYDWVTDPKYPEKLFHRLRTRHITKLYSNMVQGTKVLDIGCGTGLITQHLKGDVTGIDINPWAIEQAKEHCPTANFQVADVDSLPFERETFDVAVCTDVLEHLPAIETAINEIYRVLKLDGLLVGEVPSKSQIWHYRKFITTTCPTDEPFHHNYSEMEVRQMLRQFKTITTHKAVFGLEIVFIGRK